MLMVKVKVVIRKQKDAENLRVYEPGERIELTVGDMLKVPSG